MSRFFEKNFLFFYFFEKRGKKRDFHGNGSGRGCDFAFFQKNFECLFCLFLGSSISKKFTPIYI